jgi:hypothetical protein
LGCASQEVIDVNTQIQLGNIFNTKEKGLGKLSTKKTKLKKPNQNNQNQKKNSN